MPKVLLAYLNMKNPRKSLKKSSNKLRKIEVCLVACPRGNPLFPVGVFSVHFQPLKEDEKAFIMNEKRGFKMQKNKTIAIAAYNFKGGSQKTTSVTSLAYALGKMGKKVLIIDFDPQANASMNLNIEINDEFECLGHLIEEYAVDGSMCRIDEVVAMIMHPGYIANVREKGHFGTVEKEIKYPFYILPVSRMSKVMIRVENCLVPYKNYAHKNSQRVAFYMLKPIVEMIKKELDFDYILIDTNPSLSLLSLNAIIASDYLYMPCYLSNEGVAGVSAVYDIIDEIALSAPYFINLGIVLQRYNPRRNLDRFLYEDLKNSDLPLFETKIPDAYNKVNDINAKGRLINDFNKDVEEAYRNLAEELIEKINEKEAEKDAAEV